MDLRRSHLTAIWLGISGLFGVFGFWRGFLSPLTDVSIGDLLVVRLPFLTGLLLMLAAMGSVRLKSWAPLLAKIALGLWICTGIAAIHFLWTFHPWGDIAVGTKLRAVTPYFIGGVVIPAAGFLALLRSVPPRKSGDGIRP